MTKILAVIGEFSGEWRDEIDSATNGWLADAVNSVVANRHLIAHGRNVGITYVRIKDYFSSVLKEPLRGSFRNIRSGCFEVALSKGARDCTTG